jgi:hypothetical protein
VHKEFYEFMHNMTDIAVAVWEGKIPIQNKLLFES